MITFYQFPEAHWRHLRTTNIVESPFCGLRLRTDAARRYKTGAPRNPLRVEPRLVPARREVPQQPPGQLGAIPPHIRDEDLSRRRTVWPASVSVSWSSSTPATSP